MSNGNGNGNTWNGEDRRTPQRRSVESHIQTGFAAVLTALVMWMGYSMVDMIKEQVKSTTQMTQLRDDVKGLQSQLLTSNSDRYTANEARRDMTTIGVTMQKLEDRLDRLERRK